MPSWVNEAFMEYQKRLPREMPLILREIAPKKRVGDGIELSARKKEAQQTLQAIPGGAYVIALDERGREYSSEELAHKFLKLSQSYSDTALLVGGPEGHTDEVRQRADELWALGRLTLSHPVVRVILAETLYRTYAINAGLPYHRG